MNNLRALNLKKAYSSDCDDILGDFYVPSLSVSVRYDRLAGFFSSTSLAIAARGILGLVRNGGSMRIIASPRLSREDLATIMGSGGLKGDYIGWKMAEELDVLETEFVRDHVFALGWMVANGRLEIRVAVPVDDRGHPLGCEDVHNLALFHQKVGVLTDAGGDAVTFSGSVNESASAWLKNIEEFKVFRSWQTSECDYAEADIAKFQRFWNSQSDRVVIMNIPEAVKQKLIAIAPADVESLRLTKGHGTSTARGLTLFPHQREAVQSWLANGCKGIFEMATGTGKTFAAFDCLRRVLLSHDRLVTVIACPYRHLVSQWQREMEKFGIEPDSVIVADSSNRSWKSDLADLLVDVSLGYRKKPVVFTTHDTVSSLTFIGLLRDHKDGSDSFLIADEVHGLGAKKRARGLVDEYDMRLGLSATPKRWFDPSGTKDIYDFFGGVVFEFALRDAINTVNPVTGKTFLSPYRYEIKFVSLQDDELEEYVARGRAIAKRFSAAKSDEEQAAHLAALLARRADVVKNARGKYQVLEVILDEIPTPVRWTIIYCNPGQIDRVMRAVVARRIPAHRFTMEERAFPEARYGGLSERDRLLLSFAEGKHQILVAMKCLDEGVDVPPARTAILMASSGNPREYIQRIGRVIRRYPGKKEAIIYDIVVVPSSESLPRAMRTAERKIFAKEVQRCEEIAGTAVNNAEALARIGSVRSRMGV